MTLTPGYITISPARVPKALLSLQKVASFSLEIGCPQGRSQGCCKRCDCLRTVCLTLRTRGRRACHVKYMCTAHMHTHTHCACMPLYIYSIHIHTTCMCTCMQIQYTYVCERVLVGVVSRQCVIILVPEYGHACIF